MEKLRFIIVLALLMSVATGGNAQAYGTAGATVMPLDDGKAFNPDFWSVSGSFRWDWFNMNFDLQQIQQTNPLYEKAGMYTLDLGYGYRAFSIMGNAAYREDFAYQGVNNRWSFHAGVTIDWLQPITVAEKPLFFAQMTGRFQRAFGQAEEADFVTPLPTYQSGLTGRFGVKLFNIGRQNVYGYAEYSWTNLFLEDSIAEDPAGGNYTGVGLRAFFYADDSCPSGWLPKKALGYDQNQKKVKSKKYRNRRNKRRRH